MEEPDEDETRKNNEGRLRGEIPNVRVVEAKAVRLMKMDSPHPAVPHQATRTLDSTPYTPVFN